MKLVPKNWTTFQHYKDRCPPWIKLHRDLLNDRQYALLPIASKALAPLLWLLASESKDGSFDASSEELAFRLHIASKDIDAGLKPLIDKGFFLDASTMLAPCLQVAIPERERETEREGEQKTQSRGTRLPADWKPSDDQIAFCKAERPDLHPVATGDRFRDYWIAQPGTKGVKLDWDATWRNWVRAEKAGGAKSANSSIEPEWALKGARRR
jgi:hypothetical protein